MLKKRWTTGGPYFNLDITTHTLLAPVLLCCRNEDALFCGTVCDINYCTIGWSISFSSTKNCRTVSEFLRDQWFWTHQRSRERRRSLLLFNHSIWNMHGDYHQHLYLNESIFQFTTSVTTDWYNFPSLVIISMSHLHAFTMHNIIRIIDGHVCWHAKRQLPFIVCRPISVFRFCLQQTNGSLPFSFPFAASKLMLPFSMSSVFRLQ